MIESEIIKERIKMNNDINNKQVATKNRSSDSDIKSDIKKAINDIEPSKIENNLNKDLNDSDPKVKPESLSKEEKTQFIDESLRTDK